MFGRQALPARYIKPGAADVRHGRARKFQMAPNAARHRAGVPDRMSFDDRERLLSAFTIAANSIRPEQFNWSIRRESHRAAILRDHLLVTTRRAKLSAARALADAGP